MTRWSIFKHNHIDTVTLNVNVLKISQKADFQMNKKDLILCCLHYTYFNKTNKQKNRQMLKVKELKEIYHITTNERKDSMAILIHNKVDFKADNISWDREDHFIMIKIVTLSKGHNSLKNICT